MINRISIRNFRSIASAEIDANWITTLVGANDAGKSNVLRALNLFFNGETNPGERFDFARDHNQFAQAKQRKAQQVEIGIIFKLPGGYLREGQAEEIEWRKVWRREGPVRNLEIRRFADGREFPARSKIPTLLDRIQFTYIPAIKDKAFFADLQGRLYDVLASVAEEPLKESAGAFQNQLGRQLHGLLASLGQTFQAEATMRLPENLREIFENLEINSGDVPLSRRGDGIKIRHIPKMLEFIAVKRDELLVRGGVRYTHIWGFEEPENNVEMSAAFKMSDEFVGMVSDADHFQLFFTTHSPIFYRMDEQRPNDAQWMMFHYVSKDGDGTVIATKSPAEVDDTMGLMPIVAPYVTEAKRRYDVLRVEIDRVKAIAANNHPVLFVEGDTDRTVLSRALQLFSPDAPAIHVSNGDGDYGGAAALRSRALAWGLTVRHKPVAARSRAAALFDADATGTKERKALGEEIGRIGLENVGLKLFSLDTPVRLRDLAKKGFRVNVDLEAHYSDEVWRRAEDAGDLEPIGNLNEVVSTSMINDMIASGLNPMSALDPDDVRRLTKRFSDAGKVKAAKRVARLSEDAARRELGPLEVLVRKVVAHLSHEPAPAKETQSV